MLTSTWYFRKPLFDHKTHCSAKCNSLAEMFELPLTQCVTRDCSTDLCHKKQAEYCKKNPGEICTIVRYSTTLPSYMLMYAPCRPSSQQRIRIIS